MKTSLYIKDLEVTMKPYAPFILVSIFLLASCAPVQSASTPTLISTVTPRSTAAETQRPPPPTGEVQALGEKDLPEAAAALPQDMPQEYKGKLSEWQYTVEDNTISVDGEAWFQKNEAGEWEKVYYEQEGLRWTPSDLFGGRIKINPEKAKEIHDKLVEFYQMTNSLAGTSNSIFVPKRSESGRIVAGLQRIETPIRTDVVTIEFPDVNLGPKVFLENGKYTPVTDVPTVDVGKNQHAGVHVDVDEDNNMVFSFISYTQVAGKSGNIVLSKETDSIINAKAVTQIFDYLCVSNLAKTLNPALGNSVVDGSGYNSTLFYIGDLFDTLGFVEDDEIAHEILANPSLLLDENFVANNIKSQSAITVKQLYDTLVVDPFIARE